ncbi:MAG: EAL domain-containing protein [Hahellaceae bacterium]|nr:EAL domain-containing protein [Hahellaceae bacterium]MCP5169800.1 EAL domain-containing protein [Hahellaceae bacterium]
MSPKLTFPGMITRPARQLFTLITIALVLLFPLGVSEVLAHEATQNEPPTTLPKKPRILLVYSYHPTFPTSPRVLVGIHSVIPPEQMDLDIEYMDTKRLLDPTILKHFYESLSYKLSKRLPYDLVLVCDDNALNFLSENKPSLFPDTPLIFLGINNISHAMAMNNVADITGIVEEASFSETLSVAQRLFPDRKNVWILTDGTPSGQADLQSFSQLGPHFPQLSFHTLSLQTLSWEEWQQRITLMGTTDMIMLLSAYRDKYQSAKDFAQSLPLVLSNPQVPVFHFWEHGLGDGVIGGHIVSHFEQGREAAMLALKVLTGTPIASLPVSNESPNILKLDAHVLDHFHIDEDLIPNTATLINLPERADIYRRYLLISSAIITLMIFIWLITLRAQRKVTNEKALLRQLIDSTPDLIVIMDKEGQILTGNEAFKRFTGSETLESCSTSHLLLVGIPDGRTAQWKEQSNQQNVLLDIFKTPLHDARNQPLGSLVIARDITSRYLSELQIRRSEQLLSASQDLASVGSWEYDFKTRHFRFTKTLCDIFCIQSAPSEIDETTFLQCIPANEFNALTQRFQAMTSSDDRATYTHHIVTPTGLARIISSQFRIELGDDGHPSRLFGAAQDVTQQHQLEARLRHIAVVFEQASESIILLDRERHITNVNHAFEKLTGYQAEDALGNTPALIQSQRYDTAFYQDIWNQVTSQGQWQGEIWRKRKNGNEYPEWLTISTIRSETNDIEGYVLLSSDISRLKQSEEKLDYLAHHDPLTGLPNRLLLQVRLLHSLERARRDHTQVALLFLDLDGFKHINDSLGHFVGDDLLRKISLQLSKRIREEDTIARIGGDEFVIVMEHIQSQTQITRLIKDILESFNQYYTLHGHDLRVTASIGISIYPTDADDTQSLLRNADSAMYKAKSSGRNTYHFYTPKLTSDAKERVELESELRKALANEQFVVYYQPQIELSSSKTVGVEALVRWLHPSRGQISPDQFIPVAEMSGQIVELGEFVLKKACQQWVSWHNDGIAIPLVAVNFSARQFSDRLLTARVKRILEETGCPPHRLEVEVTEGYLMKDVEQSIITLGELRALGCSISIDDFGTGYSSLSYLKKMPVNRLKIDRSFIKDLEHDENDQGITRAIVVLARSLDMEVVAEGIETPAQLAFLRDEICQLGQGYLFSPPLPPHSLEAFWLEHNTEAEKT